jgi:hypothetical protein
MSLGMQTIRRYGHSACIAALGTGLAVLHAYAQEANPAIKTLKADIAETQMVQRMFADGLKHCAELNGASFYNSNQKRVVLLSDVQSSVQNLVKDQVFNFKKRHLWTTADADESVALAQLQADKDKHNCDLVAQLPEMMKKLAELESRK